MHNQHVWAVFLFIIGMVLVLIGIVGIFHNSQTRSPVAWYWYLMLVLGLILMVICGYLFYHETDNISALREKQELYEKSVIAQPLNSTPFYYEDPGVEAAVTLTPSEFNPPRAYYPASHSVGAPTVYGEFT